MDGLLVLVETKPETFWLPRLGLAGITTLEN